MAYMDFNYYSEALRKRVSVNIILPEVDKSQPGAGRLKCESYRTLYLFHGLTQNRNDWLIRSSIERYALRYDIAIVMPEVGRSWYTDTVYGENNFTFVTKELPDVCRSYFKGMSAEKDKNFVAGLSMGGYGAVKAALNCPDVYGGCISLSGSLDITRKNRPLNINMNEWRGIFGFDLQSPLELEGSVHDIFDAVRRNSVNGVAFPKLYLWCGTEDALITVNRAFHQQLDLYDVEHCYKESEGDHSWKWWDLHIQDGLEYLLG